MSKPRKPSPGWLVAHTVAATMAGIAMFLPPLTWANVVLLILFIWNVCCATPEYLAIQDYLDPYA